MNSRARGFTLVEVLVVALLTTIIMGAVYKTLTVQQRTARQVGVVTGTQQTVRTAMQLLDAELREIGGRAGDIRAASGTSISFRALRKAGFACNDAGTTIDILAYGDTIVVGDTLDMYSDGGTQGLADDSIRRAVVTSVGTASACGSPPVAGTPWTSMGQHTQRLGLSAIDVITGVHAGSAIRSFRTVTYGLYAKGSRYVLGRIESPPDTAVTVIGPLSSNGLSFSYFNLSNNPITAANLSTSLGSIGHIRITVRGQTPGAVTPGGTYTEVDSTDVFLRGN